MQGPLIMVSKGDGVPLVVVVLTANFEQEEDKWVGTVLELGISTYADTIEVLRQELADAVILQLNEVERLGFMDEYLKEHGVRQAFLPAGEGVQRDRWSLLPLG
jgi:hypothetical protein